MKTIKSLRKNITELKTQAKNFNPKKCNHCKEDLNLPIIIFMCGHTYCETCTEYDAAQKTCSMCADKFNDVKSKKEQYDQQAKDPQQFFRELQNNRGRHFHVISKYFGRGLFSDLTQQPDGNE